MKKLFENWRKTINEGMEQACLPNAHSLGWIDPKGEFHSLGEQVASTHSEYAVSYFSRSYGHATDEERTAWEVFNAETKGFSGPMAFLMDRLHWVRVANAYRYAGPKMENVPDDEWSKIVSAIFKLVSDCPDMEPGKNYIYEYPDASGGLDHIKEPNPQRFMTALRRRGKIAPSLTAQFRETKLFENWRKVLNESLCDYNSVSEGWIKPTGELVKIASGDSHDSWSRWYFAKYDEPLSGQATKKERKGWELFKQEVNEHTPPMVFLMNRLHWIRVANAYTYLGTKMSSIPEDEWNKIISCIYRNIKECPPLIDDQLYIYEYSGEGGELERITEKNPQRFITALRRRGKIAPSLTAQFRETKEKENLQELQVMGDRKSARYVVAWRGHVWLFPDDDLSMMKRAGPFSKAPDTIDDLRGDLEDEGRQDVLLGEIDGEDLRLMSSGSYVFDPQSSVLIKKLVKALGLRGVERQSQMGDDYEDEFTGKHSIQGKIPSTVFHGTTTKYLPGIMKTGLQPGAKPSNYDSVEHPGAVFFASRFDEAWSHALYTTFGTRPKRWGEPVVMALRIPDSAKLIPDYDVAVGSGGDEETFGYIDPETRNRAKKNGPKMQGKPGALSQEFGIYGYTGRIPAKFIQSYFLVPNVEETGKESYELGKSDIQEVTPSQMRTYLDTKSEYDYGYFSYEDIEGYDDEEELDESEEKLLMNSWRKSLKEE